MTAATRALALLAIAGCGRIGFDSASDGGARDGADGAAACFVDPFDTLDATFWRETDPATSIEVAIASGRLTLTPAPMINEYNSVVSVDRIDFIDTAFEVEVVQSTNAPFSETAIEIEYTSQLRFIITNNAGSLTFLDTTDPANPTTRIFDAAADRFWRVRHEAAAAQIRFQTGRDGVQWGGDHTIATPATGAVHFYFYVGQYQGGNPAPGQAMFDNFRIVRDGCS